MQVTSSTSSLLVTSYKQDPQEIVYRGRTVNTDTQTELFVDGIPNRRLTLADSSGLLLKIEGVRYNNNTGGVNYTDAMSVISVNSAGVASFIDIDGTTAGTQTIAEKANAVYGSGGAVVISASSFSFNTTNGLRVDLVNRAGTIPASFRLSVFGILNNILDWEFQVSVIEAGSRL